MTLFRALICQFVAFLLTYLAAKSLPIFHQPLIFLISQSGLAMLFSFLSRQPTWWLAIHLVFLPSVFVFFTFAISAWIYLVLVVIFTLIFWGTIRGDVPLFLSSRLVAETVIDLLKTENAKTFADLGAGVGTVAIPVAKNLSKIHVEAWELAPFPWLICKLRGHFLLNYRAFRDNFFVANVEKYDVIFAFLSPRAMPEVSEKLKREMRSGTLLISSSFPAPNWQPENVLQLDDRRKTVLFCYRIP
ncbi:MAG: hypothetical protein WBI40_12745 [Methylococcaceae bacterium]